MAHLEETTKCLIAMNFFVLNIEKKLRHLFAQFKKCYFHMCLVLAIPTFCILRENYLSFS